MFNFSRVILIVAGILTISAVFSFAIHRFVKKDHGSFVIRDTDQVDSVFSGNNAYHICSAYPTSLSSSPRFENSSSGNTGGTGSYNSDYVNVKTPLTNYEFSRSRKEKKGANSRQVY